MAHATGTARYVVNWQHEINCAAVYWAMASTEAQADRTALFRRLAMVEEAHARFWEEKLQAAGQIAPPRRCSPLARVLAWSARRFGPRPVLPALGALERLNSWLYGRQPDAPVEFSATERRHAEILGRMLWSARTLPL